LLRSEQPTETVAIRPNIEVTGATPDQLSLARWAVGRFEMAGMEPPALEIVFHADTSRCEGHMGWARSGRVDICTVLANEMSRRNLLHEMSHIWLDQNVGARTRDRFLHVRGLSYWNSSGDPWELRGFEQGAELMAWTLGNRILSAQIPDNAPSQLAAGFKLLSRVEIASSNPRGFSCVRRTRVPIGHADRTARRDRAGRSRPDQARGRERANCTGDNVGIGPRAWPQFGHNRARTETYVGGHLRTTDGV